MPITLLDGGEDVGMDDPFDDNLDELGFFIECRERINAECGIRNAE